MKERTPKTRLLTVLLALCMVLSLVPMVALAAPSAASDTADFTVQGGTPAIDLLNHYRTGTGISSWDEATLTLWLDKRYLPALEKLGKYSERLKPQIMNELKNARIKWKHAVLIVRLTNGSILRNDVNETSPEWAEVHRKTR